MIEEIDLEIPDENDPEVFDPECDPNNPRAIDFHQVLEAVERIKGIIQPTTCVRSRLSDRYGLELYFKKEFEHLTGSFKERGACNTLSAFTSEQKRIGAISASTGNHSSAMALHAKKLGIPVTVVMPTITPIPKINNCLAFGAKIILKGKTISEARRVALKLAHQHGYTYVNGYDHPNILAGQGTIGLEILQQVPDVDAIIVPVGGAGLIAGVTCAVKKLKPSIKIYVCGLTSLRVINDIVIL
uniref:Serine racemase n=1 Tax=Schistocephalus solidus TaxID=70667 RepID=A0A0X3NHJ2_SCHSO